MVVETGDTDGDGTDEVAVSSKNGYGPGTLGLIDGGSYVWKIDKSTELLVSELRDIDGDGKDEVIARNRGSNWVRPYDHAGNYLWSGSHPDLPAGLSYADSNGNGRPEIATFSGNGGDLSVWTDDGTLIWRASSGSKIQGISDARDGGGGQYPELLGKKDDGTGLQVLRRSSGGAPEIVWQYDGPRTGAMEFANTSGDLSAVAAFPDQAEIHGVDSSGQQLWKVGTSLSTASVSDVTGSSVPDGLSWGGSTVEVINGATQDRYSFTLSNPVESVGSYADGKLAVLTDSAIKVVNLQGDVRRRAQINGTEVDSLAVGDVDGDGTDEIVVIINGEVRAIKLSEPPNDAPTASFSYSPSNPLTKETITFDGSGSSDSDGSIATYEWDLTGDGNVDKTGETISYTYSSEGDYNVTLTVTDDDDASAQDSTTITVKPSNKTPTASIDYSPSAPSMCEEVTFDGTDSSDPDGMITSYDWYVDGVDASRKPSFTYTFDARGDHEVKLEVIDDGGERSFDSVNVSVSASDTTFDPAIHGFGFTNWGKDGNFSPPHRHDSIVEDEFRTEFDLTWLPEIKGAIGVPLPTGLYGELAGAIYDTLRSGPEELWSDGHCYGMCLVAEEYFEDGLPESLPGNPDTAASIQKPTGDYSRVGSDIDEKHRSQAFDSRLMKEAQSLAPSSSQAEAKINAEAEVRAIRSAIAEDGTALVGIGTSPSAKDFSYKHQLIATDTTIDGPSVNAADTATIDIYDPNEPATYYCGNSRQLTVDISEPTIQPITNLNGHGYRGIYHRFRLIGPARSDFAGKIEFTKAMARDLILNYVDGYISIFANSPVRIDATAPDGTQLQHPEAPVDGIPPEEYIYLTGASPGDYEISVEGTGSGDYTIRAQGATPEGGQVDDSYTGTIENGETQTLTATVPESETDDGDVSPGDDPTGPVERADKNNDGVISTPELRNAIREWARGEYTSEDLNLIIQKWSEGSQP